MTKKSGQSFNRRSFLKAAGAAGLTAATALQRSGGTSAPAAPNILLLMVDQMRMRELYTMPDNPNGPTIASLLPNITKLMSTGSKTIKKLSDPNFNPGSGVSFTNYFAAATACSASRSTLVTGLYTHQTGLLCTATGNVTLPLNTGFPTWGTILQDAQGLYGFQSLSYKTAWIGKWHLSANTVGNSGLAPYGFEYVAPGTSPNGYVNEGASGGQSGYGNGSQYFDSDAQITSLFQRWYTENAAVQPWCTTASFINPHDIADFPRNFGAILDPANAAVDMAWLLANLGYAYPISTTFPSAGGFTGSVFDGYFSQGPLAGGIPNYEDIISLSKQGIKAPLSGAFMKSRWSKQALLNANGTNQPVLPSFLPRLLDVYLWLWAMVDQQIGEVFTTLWSNAPVAENTVILFLSDHGEFGGSHGMSDKTGAAYDEGFNCPLSVWYPYALQAANQPQWYQGTRANFCSSVDICSLILSIAAGNENWRQNANLAHLAGRQSLTSYLRQVSGNPYARDYVVLESDELFGNENEIEAGTDAARHVLAYRDSNGKYVTYSYWEPCSVQVNNSRPGFVEFYDYAEGNTAEIGNDASSSPNTATYTDLYNAAIAAELVRPPPGLSGPYNAGIAAYISWATSALGGCPDVDPASTGTPQGAAPE
jgi:arylsulfatase A-like enzyme